MNTGEATKFGAEYADQIVADEMAEFAAGQRDEMREAVETMKEALHEVWSLLDAIGAHQSDDERLSILRSHQFSSAAYRVRTAMIKTVRVDV